MMKALPLLLLFPLALIGATHQATPDTFKAITAAAAPGDTIELAPGLYQRPDGALENFGGSPEARITVRSADPTDRAVIGCEAVSTSNTGCFIPGLHDVDFRQIHWKGFLNLKDLENVAFLDGEHEDRAAKGHSPGNYYTVLKCNACTNLEIRGNLFEQPSIAKDMATDFIATEGLIIAANEFKKCGRGAIQTKGDTINIKILDNRVEAGDRGIQIGGQADPPFWRRPIEEAGHGTAEIEIAGNYVVGGKACATFSTFRNVSFHHNTCEGQGKGGVDPTTSYVFRFLHEQGHDLAAKNTEWVGEYNAIVGFGGVTMINYGTPKRQQFETYQHGPNLYVGFTPGAWPDGVVSEGGDVIRAEPIELDAAGRVLTPGLEDFGVQGSAPEEPGETAYAVEVRGVLTRYETLDAALSAIRQDPCAAKLWELQKKPVRVSVEIME